MSGRDLLVAWLNDAYSMEKSLVPVLEEHAEDAEEFPDVRERDLQHAEETRQHAEMVKDCLERLGEKPSKTKSIMGQVFGRVQAMSTEVFRDELMKNFLTDYATEQFEIASYRSLAAAARRLGEDEIAGTCDRIREEEERMASWISDNMERAVEVSMAQEARG